VTEAARTASRWNVANAITVVRILAVPVLVVTILVGDGHATDWRWISSALFVAIALTDRLDGYLARSRALVTDLGKLLDPIADKLLIGAALVLLSLLGDVPWWVTVVIMVREIGVTVLRFFLLRFGVLAASRGGKLKTVLQTAAIGLFLWPLWVLPDAVTWFAWAVMIAAVVVGTVTGVEYAVMGERMRRVVPPAGPVAPEGQEPVSR